MTRRTLLGFAVPAFGAMLAGGMLINFAEWFPWQIVGAALMVVGEAVLVAVAFTYSEEKRS